MRPTWLTIPSARSLNSSSRCRTWPTRSRSPVGRLPARARGLRPWGPWGPWRPSRPWGSWGSRAARVALVVVDLARPVARAAAGLPAVLVRLAGFLLGQVGLFLGQVGLFLGQVGFLPGPVGPALRLLGRGPGLGGPQLRLLLLLLVGPAAGDGGGFGGHIGAVVRHHGRLVRLLGPLPGPFGPLLSVLGQFPRPVRVLLRAQPALARGCPIPGDTGRGGFVLGVLALDRVPGHAVWLAGLGHALAGSDLPRLVLSHDHFFPAGRPASARHG